MEFLLSNHMWFTWIPTMKASEDLLSRLYENTPLLKNTPLLPKGCDWKPKPGSSKRDAILDPSQAPGIYIYTYPLQVTARVPTHLLRKNIKIIYVYNYILKPIVETIASIQETCIHVWSFMTCTSLLFCIFLLSQIPNRTLPITQTGLRVSFSSRRTPRFWRP